MKLNKIEAVTKASVTDLDGIESLSDTNIQLRYMTDEGGWHRTTFAAGKDDISSLPDLTVDEQVLLQSVCDAACKVPETSNIQRMDFFVSPLLIKMDKDGAKDLIPEARFAQVGIRYKNKGNDELLTCDCEVLADAKGFHDACFNHKGGSYAEVYRLMQLKDEVDYQATKTITVDEPVVEIIKGKAVHSTKKVKKEVPLFDELECVDANGDGICDEHGVPVAPHKVPRMVLGKKVSDTDKARLAELLNSL